ncbi:endoribonuclease YbeY [Campylobacterota bacterium]|nr:endoribonuclease YbeY [Campylobacterota bacterium]
MVIFENETDFALNLMLIEAIAGDLSDRDIELILIGGEAMRELNRETRGFDKSTDVLSFPIDSFPHAPLGSIAISIDAAKEQSAQLGHTIDDEIAVLFLHGILHLLGFDHEADRGEMAAKEADLRTKYHLPIALTER